MQSKIWTQDFSFVFIVQASAVWHMKSCVTAFWLESFWRSHQEDSLILLKNASTVSCYICRLVHADLILPSLLFLNRQGIPVSHVRRIINGVRMREWKKDLIIDALRKCEATHLSFVQFRKVLSPMDETTHEKVVSDPAWRTHNVATESVICECLWVSLASQSLSIKVLRKELCQCFHFYFTQEVGCPRFHRGCRAQKIVILFLIL